MAGYELSRDADGNVVLVPATTQVSKPRGFLDDVASKAREYFLPRGSDFTEGTAAAYGAGQDISRRGYENFKTNPLYGAGQVIGGSALSAISPLAGATEYVTKPVGRTLGPAPEHAAEVASMFTPLPSKGASMFKLRPRAAAAEASLIPREYAGMPQAWKDYVSSLSPDVRADFLAVLDKNGGARGMAAQDSAFRVVRHPAAGNLTAAEIEAARGSTPAASAAPSAASEAVETARSISPVDMAIQQNRNPGRFVNPETGMPQSVRDPLTGQMRPAMGAVHDPFEALAQRVSEMPGPVDYLTKPRPVVNPDTGYQLQQIMPNGKFGPGRTEFTPGQRVAQGTAIGAPLAAAGYALSQSEPAINPGRGTVVEQPGERYASDVGPGRGMVVEQPGERYAGTIGPGRGTVVERLDDRADYEKAQAVAAAKQRMAAAQATGERAPQPMRRPDEGILSKIFSGGDYQSNNQLVSKPMGGAPINWGNSDNAADFFRADKAMMAQRQADEGMKRGGAANGKPDSVHKALEIIHHLLTRSH